MLRRPEVQVERGDKEQLNWSMDETPVVTGAAKALEPDSRFDAPVIGRLEISEGTLGYRDPKRKLELDGTVSTATGKAEDAAELSLKGQARGAAAGGPLRRRLGADAARHGSSCIRSTSTYLLERPN